MWTPTTREQHNRSTTRYQTDVTDGEWQLLEPLLPPPCCAGRPRKWAMREIVNAIFYILRGGIAWRLLPSDLPPWQTVYGWFATFRDNSVFEKINHALVMADRERVGRHASPTAAIIDSQSVKTTEAGGPRGGACPRAGQRPDPGDAGKKVKGRKRHALVDTDGRPLLVEPHPADIQDRDSGGPLLERSRPFFPFIKLVCADGGYNHERVSTATNIVSKSSRKTPIKSASPSCLDAGSLNASSPGSTEIADLQRMSKPLLNPPLPSSMLLPPCFWSGDWPEIHDFQNRLLVPDFRPTIKTLTSRSRISPRCGAAARPCCGFQNEDG